jgi:S-adenosylmethionine/arginine decarboxylase-like enzyme
MATSRSKPFQAKGQRRRLPLPFALVGLWTAVLVAFVAGREARKFLLFEKAWTISLQQQVDSPTCSSAWVTVDSTTEDVYENEAYQLLVDIKEAQPDKIGSEENLSMYMIDFVNSLDLNVSAYQCRSDPRLGVVSCLAVLHDDGHVSIHSWPSAGKVSLDIFARGRILDDEDVKDAKIFLKAFSNPFGFLPGSAVASNVRWTLKARGASRSWDTAISDLDAHLQDSSGDTTHVSIVSDDRFYSFFILTSLYPLLIFPPS